MKVLLLLLFFITNYSWSLNLSSKISKKKILCIQDFDLTFDICNFVEAFLVKHDLEVIFPSSLEKTKAIDVMKKNKFKQFGITKQIRNSLIDLKLADIILYINFDYLVKNIKNLDNEFKIEADLFLFAHFIDLSSSILLAKPYSTVYDVFYDNKSNNFQEVRNNFLHHYLTNFFPDSGVSLQNLTNSLIDEISNILY